MSENKEMNNVEAPEKVVNNVQAEETKKQEVKTEKFDSKKNKKVKKVKENKVNAVSKSFSELKKINWPSFKEVVKRTSVVIVVILAFLLVVFGLDKLCSWLVGLICS